MSGSKPSAKAVLEQALGDRLSALGLAGTAGIGAAVAGAAPGSLSGGEAPASWSFGDPALDDAVAASVRRRHRLQEIVPASHHDAPAAAGFAMALAARLSQQEQNGNERHPSPILSPILWCASARECGEWGPLYGPGLAALGLAPDAVVHLRVRRAIDILWAMEEALKSGAVDLVVGEAEDVDLTASRRLSLAAASHRATPILLRPGETAGHGSGQGAGQGAVQGAVQGAAWARWRIAAAPSASDPFDARAPGAPRWRVELARARSARAGGSWTLEWAREPQDLQPERQGSDSDDPYGSERDGLPLDRPAYRFRLVSGLADRSTRNQAGRRRPDTQAAASEKPGSGDLEDGAAQRRVS